MGRLFSGGAVALLISASASVAIAQADRTRPPSASDRGGDNDIIQFDPGQARQALVMEAYQAATNECLRGRTQYLLYSGVRSRSQIISQAGRMCTPTLKRMLIEKGGLSVEDAERVVGAFARQAVDQALADSGAR